MDLVFFIEEKGDEDWSRGGKGGVTAAVFCPSLALDGLGG